MVSVSTAHDSHHSAALDHWSKRDMEVEIGVRSSNREQKDWAVVFALHIPSWVLVTKTLGFNNIGLYCKQESTWFRRSLKLDVNESFQLDSFEGTTCSTSSSRSIFIQGDDKFCCKILLWLNTRISNNDELCLISSVSKQRSSPELLGWTRLGNRTLLQRYLKHKNVGGVTFNKSRICWFGSASVKFGSKNVSRSVDGIIKPTEIGIYAPSPTEKSTYKNYTDLDDKITALDLLTKMFRVPCVRTHSKFCARRLTSFEVGAALDLPVETIGAYAISVQIDSKFATQLVSLPPIKILQDVLDILFGQYKRLSLPTDIDKDIWNPSFLYKDEDYEKVAARDIKAAKADDAEANYDLWNIPAVTFSNTGVNPLIAIGDYDERLHGKLFGYLRELIYLRFCKNLRKSFFRYLNGKYSESQLADGSDGELRRDLSCGRDAISRACNASFWNWDDGSTLFFWRWQPEYVLEAQDGVPAYIIYSKLPQNKTPQRPQHDELVRNAEKKKLQKVVDHRYLLDGLVLSLTGYFSIPKGEGDIRMVYDATKCGLNDAIWAPNFWLPTMDNVADCSTSGSYFGDIDCGEMFLNFMLDPRLRPYAGVDLTQVYRKEGVNGLVKIYKRWERSGMGFRNSPFNAIRLMNVAQEIIRGDRMDVANPFHWIQARTNYPGTPTYTPTLPRVYKYNPITDIIANDIVGFVDDFRGVGASKEDCLRVLHHFASVMQYLGIQ